jgi:alanine-glyoxylate transaminase / serine-glyoxylate transaminase / serine-pyruvate transaminase
MHRYSFSREPGRHFLQIPGPTNIPNRILRAMDRPTIDHRSAEFARVAHECLEEMKMIFKMKRGRIFIYPASPTKQTRLENYVSNPHPAVEGTRHV